MRGRVAIVAILAGSAALASAEPRPMAIEVPPPLVPAGAEVSSRLIYMRRCPPTGCFIKEGPADDSRFDISQIAHGDVVIGAFTRSDAVWNGLMACMRATYAPFDVIVTDVDPGQMPHFEHIVGGRPAELRDDIPNAGGVAPAVCAELPNAMSFTFDVYGNDVDRLCWTAAQEVAHAFGLEHELNNADPMTYLGGPLPKRFQATDSPCGEDVPRPCRCGGDTQNSYAHMIEMFGPGVPTPPTVNVRWPKPGKRVQPHFVTKVDATDDVAVQRVELWIDGVLAGEATEPPYWISAPDLDQGPHEVEARAYDVQGTPAASTPFQVDLGPPCTAAAGCGDGEACVMGLCVPGPDTSGGLGSRCSAPTECLSLQCVGDTTGVRYCVETCDLSPGSCPEDFTCVEGNGAGVCWPLDDAGCCDAGTAPAGPAFLGLGVLALIARRRRPTASA